MLVRVLFVIAMVAIGVVLGDMMAAFVFIPVGAPQFYASP